MQALEYLLYEYCDAVVPFALPYGIILLKGPNEVLHVSRPFTEFDETLSDAFVFREHY
jgi:hypothetical protein